MRAVRFGSYSIADDVRQHAALPALEIDHAVRLLVAAANVTESETTVVVAAAALFFGSVRLLTGLDCDLVIS